MNTSYKDNIEAGYLHLEVAVALVVIGSLLEWRAVDSSASRLGFGTPRFQLAIQLTPCYILDILRKETNIVQKGIPNSKKELRIS
jgi:hypothetical protein